VTARAIAVQDPEAEIERRRWYAQRILRATPAQGDHARWAAMAYLKASQPGKFPDHKTTQKLKLAWRDYWRYYMPGDITADLIERPDNDAAE
jgi:hypothetical protein